MNQFDPFVGEPVRSVQTFLRTIAHSYPDVPPVIPDGRYGEQTKASVMGFQRKFGLPETGEVDNTTWDSILRVYDDVSRYTEEPRSGKLYPDSQYIILPGEESIHLFVIQAMLLVLAERFTNLISVPVSGVHDSITTEAVMILQTIFGMEETGMIESEFWNMLASLYESHISRGRFYSRDAKAVAQTKK